ncbi:hypothetical protein GlitD10_2568 [Gloeomargarita lithophora Alchichica-D10]|uniref:Uncharacterized protein n=1 Tax=Gloeomargarita lithophora Alchichica-D10 TaxID=1188229 RepID=A0A1J0AG65_9CYAN|nr:hypothetical protein [Gloeomargarita lithophora]APB34909.1 hypothetical protein GlitD10_2568 [Gloeomargarita lithophora Alchichica-D10]
MAKKRSKIISAPPASPDYPALMSTMLSIEPVFQFQRVIQGTDKSELYQCLSGYLKNSQQNALLIPNKTTASRMYALDLFTVEWFLRKTYSTTFRVPERLKKLFPKAGVFRVLRNEAEPIANLWVSLWFVLWQLYSYEKVNQHPANLFFVLLIESQITGLFGSTCVLPDGVTGGEYIAYQQGINAYLNDLDALELPID